METEGIRTIEVSGVKFDVDLRTAKKIETYRVGDKVKVLKKTYGATYSTHPGVIVGIDAFKKLPTVVIAYVESIFSQNGKVEFAYMNAQTEETEICPMSEDDVVPNRDAIMTFFNRAIDAKLKEAEEIRERKEYFLRQYGVAFGVGAGEVAAARS